MCRVTAPKRGVGAGKMQCQAEYRASRKHLRKTNKICRTSAPRCATHLELCEHNAGPTMLPPREKEGTWTDKLQNHLTFRARTRRAHC